MGARLDAKMSQRGSQHVVTPGWQSIFAVVLWLLLIAALIRAGSNDGVFAAAGWFALFVLFCVPAGVIIPGYHTGHYHDRILNRLVTRLRNYRQAQDFIRAEAMSAVIEEVVAEYYNCLLYTSPSPRDQRGSRMPSSA